MQFSVPLFNADFTAVLGVGGGRELIPLAEVKRRCLMQSPVGVIFGFYLALRFRPLRVNHRRGNGLSEELIFIL